LVREDPRASKIAGRRLGSSWYGWDGDIERHEGRLREGPWLYLLFLGFEILLVTAVLLVDAWFLLEYVLSQWAWGRVFAVFVIGGPLALWWTAYFLCIAAAAGHSRRGFASRYLSRWLILQMPFLALVGRLAGVSRDRLASSCVAITNALARLHIQNASVQRPLILLPRCLDGRTVRRVREIAEQHGCPVEVMATNRHTRAKVLEYRPTTVLAVACERDLVSGLYHFAHTMPILVLSNDRPEGPCLRTTMEIERFERLLCEILGEKPPEKMP